MSKHRENDQPSIMKKLCICGLSKMIVTVWMLSLLGKQLDFFSEVGMMKRFTHSNIVPLLGVCTRSEPVYAIMEFQLHGQ